MKYKTLAYAMDFSSFLMQHIEERSAIRSIILFGSASRDEEDETSDIDIFIDVAGESTKLQDTADKILHEFLASTKVRHYWKLLEMEREISLKVGILKEWGELLPSIIANGIVMYGKFMPPVSKGVHKAYFIWENIRPNSRRTLFNKKMFGFKAGKRAYEGLLQKFSGERLGKGCISVPLEHSPPFHSLFKKHHITVKIKKILEY
ncbi:nucleotidyltransferase domain-containing protein [Candidatus Woesearchaeota archaeon]|nr:nucleotidyltransferase domain-containing protein [Candidatus Woesearchaeota archaeon]